MKIISIDNKTIDINCIGCLLTKKEFHTFGGIVYESKNFIVSQDFEVPIPGFMIIGSKRHVSSILDFSKEEYQDFTYVLLKTREALKNAVNIDIVTLIQKETHPHFHLWFLPKYSWMDQFGDKIQGVTEILQYAKENLKTDQNLEEILNYCSKIRNYLKQLKN